MKITEIEVRDAPKFDGRHMNYSQWVRQRNARARVHIFLKDETVLQNLERRRQRPYTVYRKEVMPAVLEKMGLSKDTKVQWSQKAGCACGCSPAFIVEAGQPGATVYVTVEA